ncbi:MdtA/MuxA family multidrug efflux RND transporter periplasmic adaptor subunit [Pseudomonas berkeleyensis]|uniref:MdtA/MuxA family multidrug efflux RND transporter periplasmic adaptor subunit n=1 Tax=Pseudomonas berkeleyensis TaxID=2726956 RepID=A0A7G5DH89_9PSED|nr:MdtA/MuxA family multidrug efflux RND transporter periplasmic adaptor subunit [Pseudomonas berkeleyensis]QMV61114.1 MdtA/MuxA family multidrug efflux RND transporter periplasmic adaptor subunit [Pseudomonas berkeleyensis]WSO36540.1 MdtA/MuxA family multidrug efflux RND transporter periplasmic adaptor subunit [Pseudomonas berkeleyensis]
MSNASATSAKTSRQWLIGLTLLAVLFLLLWWFWPSAPQSQQTGRGRFGDMGPTPVRVAEVRQADFAIELKALGTVTAYNTVNVRSRVDGELVKVLFTEGQQVKAGDLLAVIDPRSYEVALQQAQGALQENQAQLKNAELDLSRYEGLYAEDSIAKQTLDTQRALVNQYRGSIKSNQADVATAKLNLDFTQIRAPISGRLGLRQLDVGNLVSSGDTTPLVVITQTDPISVIFTIPEGDLPAVLKRVRNDVTLQVEAWDRGERLKLADGVLESLDNQIDTTTGTVKLKARFENAEQMLFPNQFVNVRLRVETREAATIIPSSSLQFGNRGTFVYVVDGENKVSIRLVNAAASNGEDTLVEEGVQPGERLVLEGSDRLRDGAEVEVIDPSQAEQPTPNAAPDSSKRAGSPRTDA